MRLAGAACALGLDGLSFIRLIDPTESLVAETVLAEAVDFAERRDRGLANKIASEVSKLFGS